MYIYTHTRQLVLLSISKVEKLKKSFGLLNILQNCRTLFLTYIYLKNVNTHLLELESLNKILNHRSSAVVITVELHKTDRF